MPFSVVTRLRIRDPEYVDAFVAAALAVFEQAAASEGNLAGDAVAEANNAYWTRTVWTSREAIRDFMMAEPHRSTMGRIDEWCDEAAYVEWEHAEPVLPEWQVGYEQLVARGTTLTLTDASANNAERSYPAPLV
jgi:hypothetical protein